ncbi:MAG: methyltransferase domain-containing protein [Gammaproteobacteria bacterium]|nr:methyltransferase domain-containing protein [Gammaproteobacteria bacterium]
MSTTDSKPAKLLEEFLPLLVTTINKNGVLDLACGSGRNGKLLVRHNLPVIFADIRSAALNKISSELAGLKTAAQFWEVDFEDPVGRPLAGKKFDVILVFNYLHRPLIQDLRKSLVEGGLLFYETFTVEQAALGRPKNPDYLLKPGELRDWFEDWEILHYFEGVEENCKESREVGFKEGIKEGIKESFKDGVNEGRTEGLEAGFDKDSDRDRDKGNGFEPQRHYANLVTRKPVGWD